MREYRAELKDAWAHGTFSSPDPHATAAATANALGQVQAIGVLLELDHHSLTLLNE